MVDALPTMEGARSGTRQGAGRQWGGAMIAALLYHDVLTDDDPASSGFTEPGADIYKLSLATFDAHLRALHAAASSPPVVVGRDEAAPDLPRTADASPMPFDEGGSGPRFAFKIGRASCREGGEGAEVAVSG